MSALTLFFLALAAAAVSFAVVFVVARRMDNFGIVDIAWSLGFAPVALFYAWAADGALSRRVVVAAMVGL